MPASTPVVFVIGVDHAHQALLDSVIPKRGWTLRFLENVAKLLEHPSGGVPSCLLIDSDAIDREGVASQPRIVCDRGATATVVLTPHHDVSLTVRAMRAGAVDVLVKPCTGDSLASAITIALEHSRELLAVHDARRSLYERYALLTRREREVMTRVVSGRLNKHVASELIISEDTVKAHRGRVMRKMGASSLADLVGMALRLPEQGSMETRPSRY